MTKVIAKLFVHLGGEEGQTMVEYALILTLVSVVAIGALAVMGGKIDTIFNAVASAI